MEEYCNIRELIKESIKTVYSPDWSLIGSKEERQQLLKLLHAYFKDINFGYEEYGVLITIKIKEWVTDHGLNPFTQGGSDE